MTDTINISLGFGRDKQLITIANNLETSMQFAIYAMIELHSTENIHGLKEAYEKVKNKGG